MSKTKRNLLKLFTFMMVMCASVLVNTKEVSAAKIEFIDVTTDSMDKGDATIIKYSGKYYLVDTGVAKNYKPNDGEKTALESKLDTLKKNGKYLSGIIITHFHSDHMGALEKIAMKSGVVSKDHTVLYINRAHYNYLKDIKKTGIKNEIDKINGKFKKVVKISANEVYTVVDGSGTNGLFIYGSPLSKSQIKNSDDENNASMTVQLKTKKLKAIVFGDTMYAGLKKLTDKHKDIMIDYDVCKVGHHGLRPDRLYADTVKEIEIYKKIKAEHYIFTTNKDYSKNERYNKCTSIIRPALRRNGKAKLYYYDSKKMKDFPYK